MPIELKEIKFGNEESVEFPLYTSDKLYKELKEIIGNGKLSRSNVVVVLLHLMQIVEQYDKITGLQKKAIIISTLYDFIDNNIEEDVEKMEMKLLVQITIPTVIDTIISFDKSEVAINIKKNCSKLCSLL